MLIKYYNALVMLLLVISITFNLYLTFFVIKIPNEKTIVQDNFINVIQEIIHRIDNKNQTNQQKINYKNQIIEIIKKYPK